MRTTTKHNNLLLNLCRHWLLPLALGTLVAPLCSAQRLDLSHKPKLSIVIDDIGYSRENARQLIALQYSLTFSVLPMSPYGKELAQLAWIRGKEVMLHIPMATQTNAKLDPGGIPLGMPEGQITELISKHLQQYPQAIGINNHMGSRLTEMKPAMNAVMQALKPKELFFIDSRTSAQTVAFNQAKQAGLAAANRDIFLDNVQNVGKIAEQLEKAVTMAEEKGSALAIGHPYPETIAALTAQLPALLSRVELVPSSTLVRSVSQNQREPLLIYHDSSVAKSPWKQGLAK